MANPTVTWNQYVLNQIFFFNCCRVNIILCFIDFRGIMSSWFLKRNYWLQLTLFWTKSCKWRSYSWFNCQFHRPKRTQDAEVSKFTEPVLRKLDFKSWEDSKFLDFFFFFRFIGFKCSCVSISMGRGSAIFSCWSGGAQPVIWFRLYSRRRAAPSWSDDHSSLSFGTLGDGDACYESFTWVSSYSSYSSPTWQHIICQVGRTVNKQNLPEGWARSQPKLSRTLTSWGGGGGRIRRRWGAPALFKWSPWAALCQWSPSASTRTAPDLKPRRGSVSSPWVTDCQRGPWDYGKEHEPISGFNASWASAPCLDASGSNCST